MSHEFVSQTGIDFDSNTAVHGEETRPAQHEKDSDHNEQEDAPPEVDVPMDLLDLVQLESNQVQDDISSSAQDHTPVEHNVPTTVIELSDQDCEDVCRTIGDIGDISKLRMALQSAVYISPMLLLADAKIYKWNWNRVDILKVWSRSPFEV